MIGGEHHAVARRDGRPQPFQAEKLEMLDAVVFIEVARAVELEQPPQQAAVPGRNEPIGLVDDNVLHGGII